MILKLPGGGLDWFDTHPYYSANQDGIQNPSEQDVRQAFEALEKGWIEFVILEDERASVYIQTAGSADEAYVVEYNDGSDQCQWRATDSNVTPAHILDTFLLFRRGDINWKNQFTWQKFKV